MGDSEVDAIIALGSLEMKIKGGGRVPYHLALIAEGCASLCAVQVCVCPLTNVL